MDTSIPAALFMTSLVRRLEMLREGVSVVEKNLAVVSIVFFSKKPMCIHKRLAVA